MSQDLFNNYTPPIRLPYEDSRQYAYRVIRNFILELLLLPGQKMNESDLADYLNMSRTPIHDSFYKLSRENLVDIIPNRGAFVSKIDQKRIDDSLWIHQKLGTAILHSIYIHKVPKSELELLYCSFHQVNSSPLNKKAALSIHILSDYYHRLYLLAGNMDLIWDSLQKTNTDLKRLLFLATDSPYMLDSFLPELTKLTDAIINRDYDNACLIYNNHINKIRLLISPLVNNTPEYFTNNVSNTALNNLSQNSNLCF